MNKNTVDCFIVVVVNPRTLLVNFDFLRLHKKGNCIFLDVDRLVDGFSETLLESLECMVCEKVFSIHLIPPSYI